MSLVKLKKEINRVIAYANKHRCFRQALASFEKQCKEAEKRWEKRKK